MLASLAQPKHLRDAKRRGVAIAERCGRRLEFELGPRRMVALRSDACKDVREDYIAATTALTREMEVFDGSLTSTSAISEALGAYLLAFARVLSLTAEIADVLDPPAA